MQKMRIVRDCRRALFAGWGEVDERKSCPIVQVFSCVGHGGHEDILTGGRSKLFTV